MPGGLHLGFHSGLALVVRLDTLNGPFPQAASVVEDRKQTLQGFDDVGILSGVLAPGSATRLAGVASPGPTTGGPMIAPALVVVSFPLSLPFLLFLLPWRCACTVPNFLPSPSINCSILLPILAHHHSPFFRPLFTLVISAAIVLFFFLVQPYQARSRQQFALPPPSDPLFRYLNVIHSHHSCLPFRLRFRATSPLARLNQ